MDQAAQRSRGGNCCDIIGLPAEGRRKVSALQEARLPHHGWLPLAAPGRSTVNWRFMRVLHRYLRRGPASHTHAVRWVSLMRLSPPRPGPRIHMIQGFIILILTRFLHAKQSHLNQVEKVVFALTSDSSSCTGAFQHCCCSLAEQSLLH